MSRNTSQARHRNAGTAFQGLSTAAKNHALAVGRPVAIVAVTSGLALSAVGTAHAGAYTDQAPAPVAAAPVVAPVTAAANAPAAAPVAAPAAAASSHTVVAGDTLGAISAQYGADLHAVLGANGLSLSSIIYPGDTIVIPAAGAVVAPVAVETVVAPVETFVAPAQTVAAPVEYAPAAPVQHAASVAPAAPANDGVYLAASNVSPAPAETTQAASNVAGALVASAYSQIGVTQDCTAMVEKALRSAGIAVGDLGPSQFFQFGPTVGTPAPGDLVITAGHVAIYIGNGQVISGGMNGINATMQHPLSDLPGASFARVAGCHVAAPSVGERRAAGARAGGPPRSRSPPGRPEGLSGARGQDGLDAGDALLVLQ
ncbi:LysM peptidoglycan-binding domain-containing protein [Arthrobacter sp. RIT-PI-e]|uniref:LysM peptidoglycan-binding domain-containing protein n=1 Tax=Arthrobacter sp. RIT-PI-e TaxID=1681197 RepID=UPI0009E4D3CD|nr:LysM peptidoglycan-binding domain-containing protein [Arthrobacter sp. RIT-PI-e]